MDTTALILGFTLGILATLSTTAILTAWWVRPFLNRVRENRLKQDDLADH